MDYVTKEDLQAAVAPIATRDEMRAEIHAALVPYPTREEMRATFANVTTRDELYAALRITRDEMFQMMRDEGERTRRHAEVMNESLRDDIRLLAEGQVALHQRIDDVRAELKGDISALDRRLMRLEASRQ